MRLKPNLLHKNNRYFYDHLLFSDSPLIIACQYGNPEIVSLLCGSGFLINVVDEHNQTPLLAAVAIRHGSRDIQNQ
jgi:ankyrin repeat protein